MISEKHLPHKEPGEKIEVFLKRHWFVFFYKALFFIFLFTLPIVVYYFAGERIYGFYNDSNIGRGLLILLASIYFLSIWLFFATSFVNDFLDYWILTNKRIININQLGLFARSVAELKLINIQDVTSEISGFFPTILHYGNIYVQTAGTHQRFIFRQVPKANNVAREILALVEQYKREHFEETEALKKSL